MYKDSKEYADEIINKFPHMYKRDRESNNYFLLELYLEEIRQVSKGIYELLKSLDIMKATGYVLDKFGISFNLKRNTRENDEEYRKRILAEISRKSRNATFETIISVLKIIIDNDLWQDCFKDIFGKKGEIESKMNLFNEIQIGRADAHNVEVTDENFKLFRAIATYLEKIIEINRGKFD